jgi:MOSC domain-containing protein YiiM
MKVLATNIGKSTTILWNGKEEQTGIFKYPSNKPILLGNTNVHNDTISDRFHHGGAFKACYLFSADYYPYWKNKYPALDWDWGMFGENVTIDGMDESELYIGSVYRLGDAMVQITVPRQPCYKLGLRFKDQNIIQEFVDHGHPGTYVRIIKEGTVQKGDSYTLVDQVSTSLTIKEFYELLYKKEKNQEMLQMAIENEAIPIKTKDTLRQYIKT